MGRHCLRLAALLVCAALLLVVPTRAQGELDDILDGKEQDPDVLLEQLKAANSLLTAELWKDARDPARPGAKERDYVAEAKTHAEGVRDLDEIEKLHALPDKVRIALYQLRLLQYATIQPDTIKYEEYVDRVLAIPACPREIRNANEARKAALGSPGRSFTSYYVECLPEDVIQRREKAFIAYVEKKLAGADLAQTPGLADDFNELGRTYWKNGENDKAEACFRAVVAQKDVADSRVAPGTIGDAMMFLASLALRRGQRDQALQYCKDLLAKGYHGLDNPRVCYSTPATHAAKAVRHWRDDYLPTLDNLKLPVFTDCKPYPTPQEPQYTDRFVPLTSVRFEGTAEFPPDHPVFHLIGLKFKRYGIAVADDAPYLIKVVGTKRPETPDRPEGYYLEIGDQEAVISGHDRQGVVWGVVSFIQCVDSKTRKVRCSRIRDWPVTPRRGHSGYGDDLVEFGLFNKLNFFFNQTYCFTDAGLPDLEVQYENLKYMAKPFADFGLTFGVADRTPMYPKLCLSSDRTFQYHLSRHLRLASYGAAISMILDDSRYPLNDLDAKIDGGKGWRLDNQYVQKLYAAVKEKYPNVQMTFCPTYYWGPHWKDAEYSDTRAEYYRGIRTYLDPEIMVFWTGNQVKGYEKTKEQVQWFRDAAGRKPLVWQNAMGIHWTMGYGCEVINFTAWHYPNFFADDCAGYMANATFPDRAFELALLADAVWNPDRYRASGENREDSVKRATAQLCGQGVYELLRPATRMLGYMDRYLWSNGMTWNQHLYEENRDEIEEMYEKTNGAMAQAVAIHPLARLYSAHFFVPVNMMKHLLAQFDKPPSFYDLAEYKSGLGANLASARQEAHLDPQRDLFANAFDFQIGKPVVVAGRTGVQFFPNSPSRQGVWSFKLQEEFPGEYNLTICGRLGQEAKPTIRISLNKAVLFEGPAGFAADQWSTLVFPLTMDHVATGENRLKIENLTPRPKWSTPLTYYLNYAIVRPKPAAGGDKEGPVFEGLGH